MTSDAAEAPRADASQPGAPGPAPLGASARIARISRDAAANPAARVLTLSWLARLVGLAAVVYAFAYAQAKVGDVGQWEPLVRGAIVLIAVIVVSIWALAESWAAHERRASRRRGQKRR